MLVPWRVHPSNWTQHWILDGKKVLFSKAGKGIFAAMRNFQGAHHWDSRFVCILSLSNHIPVRDDQSFSDYIACSPLQKQRIIHESFSKHSMFILLVFSRNLGIFSALARVFSSFHVWVHQILQGLGYHGISSHKKELHDSDPGVITRNKQKNPKSKPACFDHPINNHFLSGVILRSLLRSFLIFKQSLEVHVSKQRCPLKPKSFGSLTWDVQLFNRSPCGLLPSQFALS